MQGSKRVRAAHARCLSPPAQTRPAPPRPDWLTGPLAESRQVACGEPGCHRSDPLSDPLFRSPGCSHAPHWHSRVQTPCPTLARPLTRSAAAHPLGTRSAAAVPLANPYFRQPLLSAAGTLGLAAGASAPPAEVYGQGTGHGTRPRPIARSSDRPPVCSVSGGPRHSGVVFAPAAGVIGRSHRAPA